MDYSASVVLPWHMASILWVLSAASWEDGLTYGSRDVFWRLFIKFKSQRPATMNYGVILRSARGTDLQERGGTLCNLPLQRWGPRSQRWTHVCQSSSDATQRWPASWMRRALSRGQRCRNEALSDRLLPSVSTTIGPLQKTAMGSECIERIPSRAVQVEL